MIGPFLGNRLDHSQFLINRLLLTINFGLQGFNDCLLLSFFLLEGL